MKLVREVRFYVNSRPDFGQDIYIRADGVGWRHRTVFSEPANDVAKDAIMDGSFETWPEKTPPTDEEAAMGAAAFDVMHDNPDNFDYEVQWWGVLVTAKPQFMGA